MRQNTHKGMFNSSCISNDVECELFMSDIEFTVNLSFIIKIWVFFICMLVTGMFVWLVPHTHQHITFSTRVILHCDINMFCFCLLCVESILLYIYIYIKGTGVKRTHIKKNMLIICQCCLQSYSLLLCYIHV